MEFETNTQIAIEALSSYMQRSETGEGKVIDQPPMRDLASNSRSPDSSRAHQMAVTHPMGAVGSLIDGITNNPMAIYEMGPAPATIEFVLINWMLEKVG